MSYLNRNGYYIYRFKNKNDVIVYVGRTINLKQRFLQHDHLTDDVKTIEYIECNTEADMIWKEIYYINLYYNKSSTNIGDLYAGGVTDIGLRDEWKRYKFINQPDIVDYKYISCIKEPPKLDYKNLIHILNNKKMNSIGNDKYALSEKWFRECKDEDICQLRKNTNNFIRNIVPKISNITENNIIWTTFKDYKDDIKDKGYTKSFAKIFDYSATKNCNAVAYICNNFNPVIKRNDVVLSNDEFALLSILGFLFNNTTLSNGKEIFIYLPSVRMRSLLKTWINENSLEN